MSFAMQNPCRIFIFIHVLKPGKLEGVLQILGFFILLGKYRMDPKVFMNIKKIRKLNVLHKYIVTEYSLQ